MSERAAAGLGPGVAHPPAARLIAGLAADSCAQQAFRLGGAEDDRALEGTTQSHRQS